MELKGIRGITFDAGGTLIMPNPGVGAIYAEVAAKRGIKANPDDLESKFQSAFKRLRPKTAGKVSNATERQFWTGLTREVFAGIAVAGAFDEMFPELWDTFADPRRWRTTPGAIETLSKMRQHGFRLAVLSNFDSRLHPVLGGLGLGALLDGVYISAEVGIAKPETEIFDHVARALGMEPGQLLHVGDNPIADAAGAIAAGWSAALLRGEFPGALTIAGIGEIPALLA